EAAGALAAVGLMIQPVRDLAGVWDRHRAWRVAREKCATLLAVPRLASADQSARKPLANQAQRLRFEAVTSGALSNFSVTAEPGRKIAVIGPNGAGKSTLLALAAGLELPASGNVTVGERKATGLSARERRKLIALVGTRSPILAGSLRRALTMGVDDRPDDAAVTAQAEVYGLAHVLERIGGLDGKVSEAGRNLSAGEIRRVLLARAALSQPGLLLLDEPDDALDQDGPGLVGQLVRNCSATTLVVTHNLDIAATMDEIWVIEDGGLLEVGEPADGIISRFIQRRDTKPRISIARSV
ncbi:MAG: ATP-binding cassette domain-containing protein, partial [Anderseniella sp.]